MLQVVSLVKKKNINIAFSEDYSSTSYMSGLLLFVSIRATLIFAYPKYKVEEITKIFKLHSALHGKISHNRNVNRFFFPINFLLFFITETALKRNLPTILLSFLNYLKTTIG